MAAVRAAAAHLLVGSQTLEADQFADLGVVDTASWLVPQWRGRGVGREMRAAVLHLAFAELGAVAAVTSAWHDNHASLGVSRSLGYLDNGYELHARGDRADRMERLILTVDRWRDLADLATVDIAGLRPCLPLFGLSG
ncbi:MAG: GNAT family N-acetyltransferase [Geodermatophilaceae bacterium]|nr:GNAT family N-acetyltransferase [Geodermatophilaceae bacterium]